MKRWKIVVGLADGKGGDTLNIRAKTKEDAIAQALESDEMQRNSLWEILDVYQAV